MSEASPYEEVIERFTLPVDPRTGLPMVPRPLQMDVITALAPLHKTGLYAEVGTGKTLMGTVICLYRLLRGGNQTIVLMPPLLQLQWYRWLSQVKGVTVTLYDGPPKKRRQISLEANFIIMSFGIFKNDFDYLFAHFKDKPRTGMIDEATAIKNGGVGGKASQNFKRVKEFFEDADILPMTATPLSTPGDGYAYVKLVSPTIYRNARHFEALHVEERDFFEKVVKWGNLDFLADNLLLNSKRLLKREALPGLQEVLYLPLPYELDPAHYKLYRKLADEQILLLEDGGKLDATVPSRLYHCLQQIVCNPWHFSGDDTMRSAAHGMLDSVVDQVGVGKPEGSKLFVSANYKMTNRGLLQYLQPYGAVAIYGEVSKKEQAIAIDRFKNDPDCGVCIINPEAGGAGLDGFQQVCNDILFLEAPIIPRNFHQPVGRLDRDGQPFEVRVHLPVAQGTCQVRLFNDLLNKDALVNRVQGGWKDLKDAMFGG